MPGEVIDITPYPTNGYASTSRYDEIQHYLKQHDDIEQYVIIDDDSEPSYLKQQDLHFVKTPNRYGLGYFETKEAIKILNS